MKALITAVMILVGAGAASAAHLYRWTNLDRARETTFALLSWRTALDAYALDHGRYPDVKTLSEARAAVVPASMLQAPMVDSWGHPYRFESDATSMFRIVSAGADGRFAPETWSVAGQVSSFDDDAVVTGGPSDWLFRYWDLQDKCSQ